MKNRHRSRRHPKRRLSGLNGGFGLVDPTDTASVTGSIAGVSGGLSTTDPRDVATLTGSISWNAILAATDQPDTASFSGSSANNVILEVTEPSDTAAFSGLAVTSGSLDATEDTDQASFTGTDFLGISGTFDCIDPTDQCIIYVNRWAVVPGDTPDVPIDRTQTQMNDRTSVSDGNDRLVVALTLAEPDRTVTVNGNGSSNRLVMAPPVKRAA